MTKITDLEEDVAQFKTATTDRLDRLEAGLDALRDEFHKATSDGDKRHAEIMALLLQMSTTPPTSQPTTTVVPPPALPAVIIPSIPPTGFSALTCDAAVHTTYIRTINLLVVACIRRVWISNTNYRGSYRVPPYRGMSGPRPTMITTGPHGGPYGPGYPENKVWVPGADYRLRKLKMPLFEGEDVYGWVYRVERFFEIQGLLTTGEKLRVAVLCMEGQALSWYRWSDRRIPFRTWEHLKASMLDRFQPSQQGDVYEQFLAIRQEGTVRAYVSHFESLAAQLEGVSEQILEGTFMKGLKLDLRTSVRVLQPAGLAQSMRLAIMIDESKSGCTGENSRFAKPISFETTSDQGVRNPNSTTFGEPRPGVKETRQPFKRITETELAEKRSKGLCFRCDGKFSPGHRCPDRTLKVLVIHEDEEKSDDERELVVEGRVDTRAL